MNYAYVYRTRASMLDAFRDAPLYHLKSAKFFCGSYRIEWSNNIDYYFNLEELDKIRGRRFDMIFVKEIIEPDICNSVLRPAITVSGGEIVYG